MIRLSHGPEPLFLIEVLDRDDVLRAIEVLRGLGQPCHHQHENVSAGLISAPGAGASLGPLWWQSMCAIAALEAPAPLMVLDCGVAPARAAEALRMGQRWVVLDRRARGFAPLAAFAAQIGGIVLGTRPPVRSARET